MHRAVLLGALGTAACRPWTVRPIEESTTSSTAPALTGDPTAYVEMIWSSRVLPAAATSAVDLATVLKNPPASASLFVKARAAIVTIDTKSRVGLAHFDLLPTDGQIDGALQIGPVLRGTALRDALDFVKFGDFVNQIEFAGVATALNERARRSALQGLPSDSLSGMTVTFTGAVRIDAARTKLIEIVPVVLTVAGTGP